MKIAPLPTLLVVAALPAISLVARTEAPANRAPLNFSVMTDRPLIDRSGGPQEVVVRVELTGHPRDRRARQPMNLAIVLDRSGSMSGAKLEQARQAAEMLVDRLAPDDIFSLVTYDTEVTVLVPPQPIGQRADAIRRQIRAIEPGGSTALYHGVEAGGRQLAEFFDEKRINRVLLLSDGIANVGPSSNQEIARLGQSLARQGRSVTTIGLGDDYNEDLMTALAEASDANYYHVADVEALPDVFRRELGELETVIARRLTIDIEFPDGVEPLGILGRGETIAGNRTRIAFNTLAAEQRREVFIACRVDPTVWKEATTTLARATLTCQAAEDDSDVRLTGEVAAKATDDRALAAKAQVADIAAQAEIYRNTDATRLALAKADGGDRAAAQAMIGSQIKRLEAAAASAPAPAAATLNAEADQLRQAESELGSSAGLSKEGRKQMQWNVFQRSNSKPVDRSASGTR
ncbi:MAG: VWA domain-containing protein [Verrucomicrobiales bacterium]|nr:VWA domain-containing protein [Verrucomicrobiales bacterium]